MTEPRPKPETKDQRPLTVGEEAAIRFLIANYGMSREEAVRHLTAVS
jgi:hypothetical protein